MLLKKIALFSAFIATIPAANWLIGNVGTECIPNGPCLIPVGLGLSAPSGVLMIGAALVLRDAIQEIGGVKLASVAILIGAALTWLIASPALAVASIAAFVVAEFADLAVYTPLRRKGLSLAILASGLVGSVVDSAVFLWLAFGSLDFMTGQVVGKMLMTAAAATLVYTRSLAVSKS
jgi:uncharacterized PurR-regulated membrane protein YhhQ (DUF165 family)